MGKSEEELLKLPPIPEGFKLVTPEKPMVPETPFGLPVIPEGFKLVIPPDMPVAPDLAEKLSPPRVVPTKDLPIMPEFAPPPTEAELRQPATLDVGQIVKDTLSGALRDLAGTITGTGEAAMTVASGIPSYIAGVGAQAGKGIWDWLTEGFRWKDQKPEISKDLATEILKSLGKNVEIRDKVATLGTYMPKTPEGESFAQVATAPFEMFFAGVDEVAKLMTDDSDIQEGIRFLGDIALIFGLPMAKRAFHRAKRTGRPVNLDEVFNEIKESKEVPESVKKNAREVFWKAEGKETLEIMARREQAEKFRPPTAEEVAEKAMIRTETYKPLARPEYKEPAKIVKEYPEWYIEKQKKLLAEEGQIRAHMEGKTPEEIAEIRKGLPPEEQRIVDRILTEKRPEKPVEPRPPIEEEAIPPEVKPPTEKPTVEFGAEMAESLADLSRRAEKHIEFEDFRASLEKRGQLADAEATIKESPYISLKQLWKEIAEEEVPEFKVKGEWRVEKSKEEQAKIAEERAEKALGEIRGIEEIPLDSEIEAMYQDVMQDFKKKKQAGFIKIEPRKAPPRVESAKVRKALKKSLIPKETAEKMIYEGKRRANAFRRVMEFEPELKAEPKFRNEMRLFQDTPTDAVIWGEKNIVSTIGKLSKQEWDAFGQIVGLKSLEAAAKQGQKVPYKLTSSEIQKALADLEPWKTDKVSEALARHEKITRMIGEDLVKRGKMPEEALKDFYFPHRVLDYLPEWADWKGLPRSFKRPYRGYIKKRLGTKRGIDMDYISAMRDYYAKVYLDNAIEDFMYKTVDKYDISGTLSDKVKSDLFGADKRPKPKGLYEIEGKEYRGFQFDRGNVLYPSTSLNEGMWQKAIAEGWSVAEFAEAVGPKGGKSLYDSLSLGGKHKTYLLPKAIAERLERFRIPAGDLPLFWDLRNFTSLWKRVTLDFAGIPFQLNNFFGDGINLYKTDPGAFTKLREAASIMFKKIYKPELLTPEEIKILDLATEHRVTTTHFFKEAGVSLEHQRVLDKYKRNYNPWNYFVEPMHQIEKISVGREATLRLAKFMKDMDRISKGESVVAGEANIKGLNPIDAAGKASREFTVDYGAVSPPYRRFLRGFLMPFMSFYDFNARNWVNYAVKHPGKIAIKVGVPLAAMWTWNNTGKRREIEENLGFWRNLPHVITGYETKEGKPIIIAMQTPVDMAVSWFGLDRLPAKITDIRAGKMSIKEAAIKQLKDTALGSPRQIVQLLNPLIHIIQGLLTNKDPYTKRTIVPERFKGTEYENRFVAEYTLSQILTPYGQYMRLRNEIELSPETGKWGAWLLKGPLDVIRALGIRKVDLDRSKMAEGYGEKEELSQVVKNKLAVLELGWIKANLMDPEKAGEHIEQIANRVNKMEGPMPTSEQIANRLCSIRTLMEICTKLIQQTKDKKLREELKECLKFLREGKYIESMTTSSMKAIRPELWPKALSLFFEEKEKE